MIFLDMLFYFIHNLFQIDYFFRSMFRSLFHFIPYLFQIDYSLYRFLYTSHKHSFDSSSDLQQLFAEFHVKFEYIFFS